MSHVEHPAFFSHTAHKITLAEADEAHASCFTPSPFDHRTGSPTGIGFLHVTHLPGYFIDILLQLMPFSPSLFGLFPCALLQCLAR